MRSTMPGSSEKKQAAGNGSQKNKGEKPKPQRQKQNKKKKWNKVKKEVKKDVKKEITKVLGPKPQFTVKVTASLGFLSGVNDIGPLLKLASFLHPSLCKSEDDRTAFGPLQAAAAQYGLWRIKKCHIKFNPLVGPSAVSGSIFRASLNMVQTPSNVNWGGLGARKHRDVQTGRSATFILSSKDLAGPRDGGWWLVDTNNEGAQSAGPIIEVHGLGKTESTYQDKAWTSDLFIVELMGIWEFANYNMNPGMGQLERLSGDAPTTISTEPDGKIVMTVQSGSTLASFMQDDTVRADDPNSTGETIFQVVDTGVSAISSLAPVPFNWLIKGGWWFVKKLAGRTRLGDEKFLVFASLADAQNNRPAVSTMKSQEGKQINIPLSVTQINTPNMGGVSSAASGGQTVVHSLPVPITENDMVAPGHVLVMAKAKSANYPYTDGHGINNSYNMFLPSFLKWKGTSLDCFVFHCERFNVFSPSWHEPNTLLTFNDRFKGVAPRDLRINVEWCTGVSSDPVPWVHAWKTTQIASGVWANAILLRQPDNVPNMKGRTGVTVKTVTVAPKSGSNLVCQFQVSDSQNVHVQWNMPKPGPKMCVFFTTSGFRPSSAVTQVSPSGPVGNFSHSWIFDLAISPLSENLFDFAFDMTVWQEPASPIHLLSQKLGLPTSEIRDLFPGLKCDDWPSSDDEDSASDDDEDGESFDVVPETASTVSSYKELRESGLSHEQAIEVLNSSARGASGV